MLATIVILVALVAFLLVRAARQPELFQVQRSARIAATPEQIFPHLQDFRRWRAWSPYERLDPEMKRTLGGAASGVGATYEWSSSGRAGVGRMEIVGSEPCRRLRLELDIRKPVETHNVVDFTLVPADGYTTVTWAMQGPNNFLGKVVQSLVNMDRVVGRDFESGLANLDAVLRLQQKTSGALVA